MFDPDISIDNEESDVLNRGVFAKKLADSIGEYKEPQPLVIGLNGSWGSGKTSLINLTLNQIDPENYLVIKFNPWFFSNQNNLYLQFFKLIINELKKAQNDIGNPIGRKLTHVKNMFRKPLFETLQSYYDYIKSNSSVNLKVNDVGLSVSSNEESFESLQFHKYQCDIYFEYLDFKLLIIIDDIDRLIDEEIKQVFTLVKSLASFPNVVYLLAFDKNVVEKSLDRIHSDYANKFVDKIIQIPITVPYINESKLNELILTNIGPIYNEHLGHNFINSTNEFNRVSQYLQIFIKDIRDLKRYINILNFYLDIFIEELNINDFFLILAIQIFEYKLYLKIKEYGDILTHNDILFSKSEEIIASEINNVIADFKINTEHTNFSDLMKLLEFLFPILDTNYSFDNNVSQYVLSNDERRLRSNNHFEKYFTLSLENNEVSAILLDRLIQLDNVDEICEVFTYESNLDYNHSLLTQFRKLISQIPNENVEFFIRALMKCGDEMKVYHISRRSLEWILDDLCDKIKNPYKCFEVLEDCISYKNNVFTVSEYVYSLSFDYGLAGDNKNIKSEDKMPIDKEHTFKLKDLVVKKIRNCSKSKDFLNQTFLEDMLTYWALLDNKDNVKEYVLNNVKSEEEILSFLSGFQTIQKTKMTLSGGNSKSELVFNFKKLDSYHGLKFYEKTANGIMLNESASLKDKEFCKLFLRQLSEYRAKQVYPLFISHCWDYRDKFYTVEGWIDDSNINWRNMSIPAHDPKDTRSDAELEQIIDNNIRNSSIFIIIAGMYVSQENRTWINKEIDIAQKYGKNILAIKPWGSQRTPSRIQEVADKLVSWQSSSVINGIKELL